MATIGQSLPSAETGYTRYDDTNANITGGGAVWNSADHYNGSAKNNNYVGATIQFNFTGSKLRPITANYQYGSSSVDVFIDGVKKYTMNLYSPSTIYRCLSADITGLSNTEHYCKLVNNTADNFYFDAVDIDSTGVLKPYNTAIKPTQSQCPQLLGGIM